MSKVALAFLPLATTLGGWGLASTEAGANSLPPIICSVDDRSGAAADTGNESFRGLEIAVDAANAQASQDASKIEIVEYDGKLDPQLTASFAARCAEDDRALAIIGGNPTALAAAIIPIASEYEIPFFMLSSAADNLTDEPAPFHFRIGPANYQDSQAIADLLIEKGFSRPGLVYGSLPSLTDGGRAVKLALETAGLSVVVEEAYDVNATDLSPQIINVRDANPDILIVFPYPADGGRVLRTAAQMGLTIPIISPRSGLLRTMREIAGADGNGVLIPNTVDPARSDVAAFFDELNTRFGEHQPTLWPVLGYDAGNIVIAALAEPEVQEALEQNDLARARIALRDAVERIGEFSGLQGLEGSHYSFGPGQHHGSPDQNWFTFMQVEDDGATLVKADLDALTAE